MAQRRMFSKSLIDSDRFIDMPLESQALYFHLGMQADDDGFIGNCKRIARMVGCSEEELEILCENGFLISFESGIYVIRHWMMHNYIRKDSYKKTVYHSESAMLGIDENGLYYMLGGDAENEENTSVTDPLQSCDSTVTDLSTQDSIGKDSTGKDRESKDLSLSLAREKKSADKKPYGEFENVMLSEKEYLRLKGEYPEADNVIAELSDYMRSKGARYEDHYATLRIWCRDKRGRGNPDKSRSPTVNQMATDEDDDEFLRMAAIQRERRLRQGIDFS